MYSAKPDVTSPGSPDAAHTEDDEPENANPPARTGYRDEGGFQGPARILFQVIRFLRKCCFGAEGPGMQAPPPRHSTTRTIDLGHLKS